MAEFTVDGEEMIDRVAEKTDSGVKISVPESWDGEHVKVVRTDRPFALRTSSEFVDADSETSTGSGAVTENDENTGVGVVSAQNQTRDVKRIVKNTIAELNTGDGALVSDVIREVTGENVTKEVCMDVIDELRRCGEVYKPAENRIKQT
jgi:hypothetical protein